MKRSARLWREYRVIVAGGYLTTCAVNQLGIGTMSCRAVAADEVARTVDEIRRSVPHAQIRIGGAA